ncbi:MAG: sugar ABC transporter permease [Candidatus Altiarchaeales archaeon WOR_SM1_79]|nr:MAG: sugar ABC transporter permease [Candidatus Altiarchaeales archaeon WOR_SM1_79]
MKKVAGIAVLLFLVMIVTGIIDIKFFSPYNIKNIFRWTGIFGILSLGEAFVIITGGIDLSLGSICGLVGSLLPMLIATHEINVALALFICFAISLGMGISHGVLVTKLKMQPFVVTLCGLFIYRGVIRFITNDVTQSFGQSFIGLKFIARGLIPLDFWSETAKAPRFIENWSIPMPLIIMVIVAVVLWLFLNRSIYGRYLLALGRNENAARFSGINTDRMIIVAYTISALLGGLAAILFALHINGSQPSSQGIFFELYAIAGAVLGGCSLRGGEGNILGIILGTAVVRVLYNVINILGIATQLEYAVVGVVIIAGVGVDDFLKIYTEKRRAKLS